MSRNAEIVADLAFELRRRRGEAEVLRQLQQPRIARL